jgi:hypothetical protein
VAAKFHRLREAMPLPLVTKKKKTIASNDNS